MKKLRVSDRMAKECEGILKRRGYNTSTEQVYDTTASHEGAALAIWAESFTYILGSDRAGKKRRRAENIGSYVANNLIQDIGPGATVDRFLADQLII